MKNVETKRWGYEALVETIGGSRLLSHRLLICQHMSVCLISLNDLFRNHFFFWLIAGFPLKALQNWINLFVFTSIASNDYNWDDQCIRPDPQICFFPTLSHLQFGTSFANRKQFSQNCSKQSLIRQTMTKFIELVEQILSKLDEKSRKTLSTLTQN